MRALLRAHLLLMPPVCWTCGGLMSGLAAWRARPPAGYPYLCAPCHAGLPRIAAAEERPGDDGQGGARPAPTPPRSLPAGVARVVAATGYAHPVRGWLQRLKYERKDSLARLLGLLLDEAARDEIALGAETLVVPVPLHPLRLWRRGFNQSLLLARSWLRMRGDGGDRASGIRAGVLAGSLLVRHRNTVPQVRVTGAERRGNVADAFSLHPRLRGPAPLRDRHIVLVDDVTTTGATLAECAAALRDGGAARVEAVVVART